eukprot:TRINITY_DN32772_c0_g1_i1.p1 TRINITY_DN32772_c0_g1~~TRINITY_DN32772_c0_g1_i1.p1  ORF type:complete len:475 (+),score=41.63 TRINITY_DN32772_c0_g1_i1:283-1707(+)
MRFQMGIRGKAGCQGLQPKDTRRLLRLWFTTLTLLACNLPRTVLAECQQCGSDVLEANYRAMEAALSSWEEENMGEGGAKNRSSAGQEDPSDVIVEEILEEEWTPSHWQEELDAEAVTRNASLPVARRKLNVCDYRSGSWYPDSTRPPYGSKCQWIRTSFNCIQNGRLDTGYVRWSWRPSTCTLPKFDPTSFCHKLQGKLVVFIGDSFAENFYEALICQLDAHFVLRKYVAHIAGVRSVGVVVHKYNVRILYINSPYLVKYSNNAADFTPYGITSRGITDYLVWLDKIDPKWAPVIKYVDLSIWLSGHWFQVDVGTTAVRTRNFVQNNKLLPNFPGPDAYKIALGVVNSYLKHDVKYKGVPVYSTYSPSHYTSEAGKTPYCKAAGPFTYAQAVAFRQKDSSTSWHNVEATVLAKSRFRLLDVTFLSNGRPDGHVETYYGATRSMTTYDCTHWCLPGVPDIWVDAFHYVLKTQVF